MLYIVRRLLTPFLFLAALLCAVFAVFALAGIPLAEDRAASAISSQLGGNPHVTVKAKGSLGPGLLAGDLGDLVVHADKVGRQGFTVTNVRGRVYGVSLDVGALITGSTKISFSRIVLHGNLSSATLNSLLQARLATAGIPTTTSFKLRIKAGVATAVLPTGPIALKVSVAGGTTLKIVPTGGGAALSALRAVLVQPIDVGPLPYGLTLDNVRLVGSQAIVTAERGSGSETL